MYPTAEKVRDEIIQTLKGMMCASVCPAISVYLAQKGSPITQVMFKLNWLFFINFLPKYHVGK